MTGWAIEALAEMTTLQHRPLVVELGTGSGAIAKSIATELTRTDVHAVELSPEAAAYARRNLADTLVELHVGDMADALPELDGTVDLVIANPPYIPLEAYASVPPEVRDHDPLLALFSGDDGLDAIRVVARHRGPAAPARPASSASSTPTCRASRRSRCWSGTGAFRGVRDHLDLTGDRVSSPPSALTLASVGKARRRAVRNDERTCFSFAKSDDARGSERTSAEPKLARWAGEPAGRRAESLGYQRFDCTGDEPALHAAATEAAREAIEAGECIVLPTDTVYGIGADAFSPRRCNGCWTPRAAAGTCRHRC